MPKDRAGDWGARLVAMSEVKLGAQHVAPLRSSLLFFVDDAALHYEAYFCCYADVLERIAGDGDDVREVALFQSADLILPAEDFCAVEHICLQHGERLHSVLRHEDEFA